MRFTPTGPDRSLDQTKARLTNYQEHQTTHGFSKWMILDRRLGCAIGDSGLLELREYVLDRSRLPTCPTLLGQRAGDRGSVCLGSRRFHDLHLDRLTAFVHPENYPSIRILGKLGFHFERRDTVMGMNSILFSLLANDARITSGLRPLPPLRPKRAACGVAGFVPGVASDIQSMSMTQPSTSESARKPIPLNI